jgi:carboxypeptidase family protein
MRRWTSSACVLAAVLSSAPGAAAPVPFQGSVRISRSSAVSGAGAELRPLSDPERSRPLPLTIESQGGMAVFRGAAPEPRLWRVAVRADGAATMALDLPLLEESVLLPLDLPPARRLQVRVTDPAGRPLAGAEVGVTPLAGGADAAGGWRPAPAAATTGPEGSAALPAAPSVPLLLAVSAPGFPLYRQEIAPTAPAEILVRLKPGLPRKVEARSREGQPVQGVAVATADGHPLGTTDASGRLEVAVAAGEALPLRLLAADGRWARGTLKAAPDGGGPAVFLLEPPEEIRGQVVDRQTRRPVAGALVWVDGSPLTMASTDAAGRYTLRLSAGGEAGLRAAAAGYLAGRALSAPAAAPRGPRQMPALALAPAVAVQGLVVDGTGRPLADVDLRAASSDRRSADPDPRARTGPKGTFRLSGLAPGEAYRLSASRDGFVPSRLPLAAPQRGAAAPSLRIVLESGRAATGRVVDRAGKPVADAEVRLLPVGSDDPRSAREATLRAVTGASGTFRIDRLAGGPFNLRARARGFAPTLVRRVDLPPGNGSVDLGTLVLERGLTLEGRVVDTAGNPIGGATVQVTPSTGLAVWDLPLDGEAPGWETVSGRDGAFSFAGLAPGGETLRASRQGFAARTLPGIGVPSAEPVLVRLDPAARISGTVKDDSGEPVAGANVLLSEVSSAAGDGAPPQDRTRPVGAAVSDAEGRFAAADLPPGRFSLLAAAPGFLSATLKGLDLPDGGEIAGVEVVLPRGATVQGTVSTPDGTPAAGAKVIAIDGGGAAAQTLVGRPETIADGDGHYQLGGVSEGPHTILAEHPDFRPARRPLQVQPGSNTLDLRLERGAEISGRIASREGPVAGADVRLLPQSSGAADALPPPQLSGPDGAFRFPQVGDGRYRLLVEKPRYSMASPDQEIRIAGAPVTGLEVRLESGGAIAGRITGLDFQSLARVQVVATSPALPGQAGQIGYDGTYRIEGLAPGEWTVVATLPESGRRAGGRVPLGEGQAEASLDLEFASGFVLSGRVERHGAPVPGALILVQGADGGGGDTVTGSDGGFRVEGLRPGAYDLTALQPRSGLRVDQRLQVDGDREVVLALPEAPAPAPRGSP